MGDEKKKPSRSKKPVKSTQSTPIEKQETISVEQWQSDLTAHLTKEVLGVIRGEELNHGRDFGDMVRFSLIASLIASVIYDVLSAEPDDGVSLAETTETVTRNYREAKEALQYAVASGFEGAMRAWTGGNQEFWCEITPEPEPLNKLSC